MLNHINKKEEKMDDKQKNIDQIVAKIINRIDFNQSAITVFIRDIGDPSRYHETVLLDFFQQVWSLHESYLTPEFSFQRKMELPYLTRMNIEPWLKALFLQNDVLLHENHSCPKDGLSLPSDEWYLKNY